MGRLREEIEKCVDPRFIGVAFFTHETLAVAWMFGLWSVFYMIEPTQSLRHKFPSINDKYEKAEQWTNRRLQRMPNMIQKSKFFQSLNYPRLVTSGIESCLMRRLLSPITYPVKIGIAIYVANVFANYRQARNNTVTTNNNGINPHQNGTKLLESELNVSNTFVTSTKQNEGDNDD